MVVAELAQDEAHLSRTNGYMCSGTQLLDLARRCVAAPLVCRNVHPRNLLLAHTAVGADAVGGESGSVLQLLDLGCDWVPSAPCAVIRCGCSGQAAHVVASWAAHGSMPVHASRLHTPHA